MEWIAIGLIGWLGWQYLRKTGGPPVYRKSDAASSLQRLLEHVSQEKAIDGVPYQHIACGLIENAWQGLSSEQAWLRVSGQATDKASCTPHKITLICYALVLALKTGVAGYKRNMLLLALGNALQEAKNHLTTGFSKLDFVLLESNMSFYIQMASESYSADEIADNNYLYEGKQRG